jgi:cell division protein FtsW (lipid II flippase)
MSKEYGIAGMEPRPIRAMRSRLHDDSTRKGSPWLLLVLVQTAAFSLLLSSDPQAYASLTEEDYWVEYLTVFLLLATGLILFASARLEDVRYRRWAYVVGALAFVGAAGEEISWGQRLLGIETPEYWKALNEQDEITLHNLDVKLFNTAWHGAVYLLVLTTLMARAFRRDALLGFRLPSLPIAFAFVVMLAYRSHTSLLDLSLHDLADGLLLLLLCAYVALFLVASQRAMASCASLTILATLSLIHFNHGHSASVPLNRISETQEYLFAFLCLGYALELARHQRRLRADRPDDPALERLAA